MCKINYDDDDDGIDEVFFSTSLGCYSLKVLNSVSSCWFVSYRVMNKTKAIGSMIATHVHSVDLLLVLKRSV